MMEDETVGAAEIGRVIEADTSLTARTLRLANSAFLGIRTPVTAAQHAVVVLGFSVVRSLAVSSAAGLLEAGPGELPARFWEHSIGVAAAASLVAPKLDLRPGDAFSGGMLHDLGAALMFRRDKRLYRRLPTENSDDESPTLLQREQDLFGITHPEAGAAALEHWGLPDSIVDAIRDHHLRPGASSSPLHKAVWIGEIIHRVACGADRRLIGRAHEVAGLEPPDPAALLKRLQGEADAIARLLASAT